MNEAFIEECIRKLTILLTMVQSVPNSTIMSYDDFPYAIWSGDDQRVISDWIYWLQHNKIQNSDSHKRWLSDVMISANFVYHKLKKLS